MACGCETRDTSQADHLKNKHMTPMEEEECEYLEPIQSHVYTELTEELTKESDNHARQQEPAYEPVGSMEQLE